MSAHTNTSRAKCSHTQIRKQAHTSSSFTSSSSFLRTRLPLPSLLLSLLSCLLLASPVVLSQPLPSDPSTPAPSTYPLDWSQVSSTPPALSIPKDTELGPCICDLTWGVCDVNCRCDTDCTETERSRFSSSLREGPQSFRVQKCMDPQLMSVNRRGALTITLIDNMLCVAEENNPSQGLFLNPPQSLSASEFNSARSSLKYLYEPEDPLAPSPTPDEDAFYKVDSHLQAARIDTTATPGSIVLVPTQGGQFVLPTAGSDGQCSDHHYLRYQRPTTTSCLRRTSDLEAACVSGGLLSGARYASNLVVGKQRSSSPALPSQYVAVNLTAVYTADPTTGALTLVGSHTYPSNTNWTTSFDPAAYTFPEPTWDAASCTCQNVLQRVQVQVVHEEGGTVAATPAPGVQVVLTDVVGEGTCGGAATVRQYFDATFQLSSSPVDSTVVPRPKSGNPGYLIGLPVLSGHLRTQSSTEPHPNDPSQTITVERRAVEQDRAGMQVLPIAAGGRCTSLQDQELLQSVGFGQDAQFSCFLPLTLSDLQSVCAGGIGDQGTLPYLGVANLSTHLGVWGNSDFDNINQWVQIEREQPTAGTWVSATRTCGGLPSSLNLEIATIDAGAFKNPQRRILAARLTFSSATWTFTGLDPAQPQLFPLYATVSFIHLPPKGVKEFVPTSPPLLPKFPHDLLYPLYIPNAAPATSRAPSSVLLLLLALLPLLLSSLLFQGR